LGDSDVSDKIISHWSIARATGYSVLAVILFFSVQFVVVLIVLVVQVANDPELNIQEWADQVGSDGLILSLATFGTTLLCLPFVKFLAGRREDNPWAFLRLIPANKRSIFTWISAMLAFVVVSDLITIAVGRPVVPEFMSEAYSSVHPALLFLALVFAAPMFEEIFCRGFIIGALESSGVSAFSAAVVSSLAWSALHVQYDLYIIVTIFLMGMLLAAARTKTGSLVPCLVMHSLANVIAFTEAAIAAGTAA
jgi:membrane protease YdiL (CAAX protease family)